MRSGAGNNTVLATANGFAGSAVFTASSGGVWLPASHSVDSYGFVGITIEDAGGAKAPSAQPFMLIDLSKSARAIGVPLPR